MTQQIREEAMPFGIQHTKSRMAELLAADVVVAAGSATLITPAVMIFDRLVVEKSFYNQPLFPAFRRHLWFSLTQPATFLTSRPSLLVWSLYTATFATANASETILSKWYPKIDHAIAGMTTFASTFIVNSSVGIWKDVKFAQLFGHSNTSAPATNNKTPPSPTPTPASTSNAASTSTSKTARSIGRTRIPVATYSAFLIRDALTIFGSFSLPAMVSASIPDSIASQEYLKILIAQLAIPASIQLVSTPIHLLGLDLYNRPQVMPTKDRINRVSRDWIGASLLRMCRIIPAFGIGGFVNTEGRLYLHDQVGGRRKES
ncbi:hypothetical protein E8E15_011249 [Penicillium rubens]|uniref:Pc13g06480 protein n=2 Tax=Penicillium chrysogenum species complex TaxID=254878 RepID=B6H3G3_PENRW|nr:uncharacterized protein N7525_003517 [Penicillium rubens]KZN92874.1 putative membrane protein [Penicillium chrysogenum]CAP91717.1 Pc13g06480 [Penicillium rubens Wisconsin 54-1255]KAF3030865.1 hypothetical protein E8E15_011249 [Penicillium rubens]KAJ5045620.1 hypothetical protein NUH16_002439 [Penicillium rubens]KAJ5838329.1 hypothetical protein N7525_003517 [Penicillium rubens]